jgi:hypothetical protein
MVKRAGKTIRSDPTLSDPERLGRVIRGLASDLVEERRRANALAREVKQLRAELEQARRGASERAVG